MKKDALELLESLDATYDKIYNKQLMSLCLHEASALLEETKTDYRHRIKSAKWHRDEEKKAKEKEKRGEKYEFSSKRLRDRINVNATASDQEINFNKWYIDKYKKEKEKEEYEKSPLGKVDKAVRGAAKDVEDFGRKTARTTGEFAYDNRGKIAVGAAVAAALYGGYKLYKAWRKRGKSPEEARKGQISALKKQMSKCNKAKDSKKCKDAIQKKIKSLEDK